MKQPPRSDPMTRVLARFRDQEKTAFADAWVGLEPTFQTAKSVRKWKTMSTGPKGEDAYFEGGYMPKTLKKVARAIRKRYEAQRRKSRSHCMFAGVELAEDLDPWEVRRQNLIFRWADADLEPLQVRLGLDPETFEYSIKPVPLAWFYDERFVAFLEEFVWKAPLDLGLSCSIAHGGAQFSLSAKTFLQGSLLADDIAYKLSHPELATWIMDWPNPDDRAFRATRRRLDAFRRVLQHYWAGGFHPRTIGILTAEHAYLDRGFGPGVPPAVGLMDPRRGPTGSARDVFQTNFAFGRTVRLQAQNVHPGYWQSAHPDEEGYRPDQIMRYGEGNINRLQIVGELHVKSGKVLEEERVPELDAPLQLGMLTTESSWENRAQMGRTSARDYVEALLLAVHHAQYLQEHPHVGVANSLHQDQLLGDAEHTLTRRGATTTLARLRRRARKLNLESSRGRIRSDWIEPETLFWAAWRALRAGEKAAIAREAIGGFLEHVVQAATMDPRPAAAADPMEWHRHRIHPLLWEALGTSSGRTAARDPVRKELRKWQARRSAYLARRPPWSPVAGSRPPWQAPS